MKTYEEIIQAYKAAKEEEKKVFDEYEKKEEQLAAAAERYRRIAERKDKEREKMTRRKWESQKTHWTDNIVKPLMDEISQITGIRFDTSDLRTYGISCRCPVSAKDENGKYLAWVTFVPDDEIKINMYSGEMCDRYPKGSIGELNGYNNIEEPVTSIESILDNLRRNFPKLNIA